MTNCASASEETIAVPARIGTLRLTNGVLFTFGSALFLLPNLIFAADLNPIPAAIVLLGAALALNVTLDQAREASASILGEGIDPHLVAFCGLFAVVLCLLGGEAHIFYANTDWLSRDAVLSDLVQRGFPVGYQYENQDYVLRAPLGMYMTPALVGRLFGLTAAHFALLAQNAILTTLVFYFLALLAGVRKIPFLLLFVLFSGADVVPIIIIEVTRLLNSLVLFPFSHIEWWAQYWFPNMRLQYSSHITQLFWVPNHGLPGWWFTLLALLHARRAVNMATLIVSFAFLLFWSPLSMMGAAPFVAAFGLRLIAGPDRFAARNLVAGLAAVLFVPVAFYLVVDAGAVAKGFLVSVSGFWSLYMIFILVEIPQVSVIILGWRRIVSVDRPLLAGAIVILLLLPVYTLGPSNDFAMRASIVPLALLGYGFARIAVLTPRDNSAFPTLISVLALLGATTGALEIKRAFVPSYAISNCNLLTAWHKDDTSALPTNYWARAERWPSWLSPVPQARLKLEDRQCWPDHPLLIDELK